MAKQWQSNAIALLWSSFCPFGNTGFVPAAGRFPLRDCNKLLLLYTFQDSCRRRESEPSNDRSTVVMIFEVSNWLPVSTVVTCGQATLSCLSRNLVNYVQYTCRSHPSLPCRTMLGESLVHWSSLYRHTKRKRVTQLCRFALILSGQWLLQPNDQLTFLERRILLPPGCAMFPLKR